MSCALVFCCFVLLDAWCVQGCAATPPTDSKGVARVQVRFEEGTCKEGVDWFHGE